MLHRLIATNCVEVSLRNVKLGGFVLRLFINIESGDHDLS